MGGYKRPKKRPLISVKNIEPEFFEEPKQQNDMSDFIFKLAKYSFSKKILCAGLCGLVYIVIYTSLYVLFTGEVEPLIALISIFGVCLTAAVAFYFWKERSNNNAKYAEDFIEKMADKYGIENVATILQILFSNNIHTE